MKHLDMSNAIASAPANTRQVSNSAILTTERSYSEIATDNGNLIENTLLGQLKPSEWGNPSTDVIASEPFQHDVAILSNAHFWSQN